MSAAVERAWAWLLAPRRRRPLLAALVALAVLLGVLMVRRATRGSSDYPMGADFSRRLVLEGENVYETESAGGTHTKYPPFTFLLWAPFAALPLGVGAALYYLLQLAALAGCAWWAVGAVRPPGAGTPPLARVLAPLALGAPLILVNLPLGQVNVIVLACVAFGLAQVARGRPLAGGAGVVAAAALKLTPGLLVAGFAWKRAGRVLLGAALGLAVCWVVLPLAALGPTRAVEATRSWARVVGGFVHEGAAAEASGGETIGYRQTNQSLDAAVHRLLCDVPAVRARGGQPGLFVNVARLPLDSPWIGGIVKGLSALLLLALLWLARGRLAAASPLALGLEVSLALLVVLAVAPISWDSHYIALLVPYATALEVLARRPRGDRLRTWLGRALAACVLLTLLGLCPYARAWSVMLLGALLLGAALAAARVAERRAAQG